MLVTLTLTPDDFLHGSPCNPHGCPTYLALKRITLPGLKVIVQPENALIIDPCRPDMVTVQFPEELVKVIQRHDDYATVLLEPETFQLDIPKEVLRDEVSEARPEDDFEGFENEVNESLSNGPFACERCALDPQFRNQVNDILEVQFAEAIRAAFKEAAEIEREGLAALERIGLGEPRETRYGQKELKPLADNPEDLVRIAQSLHEDLEKFIVGNKKAA